MVAVNILPKTSQSNNILVLSYGYNYIRKLYFYLDSNLVFQFTKHDLRDSSIIMFYGRSGGKDSMYTIHKLNAEGYRLVCLLYMEDVSNTIDSYMFQSVGSEVIDAYAECLGVPLYKYKTISKSINQDMEYEKTNGDEVEDLYEALKEIKEKTHFSYVSSGAILSKYQKNRVENVCARLDVKSLSPLWEMDQTQLLGDMIKSGIDAVLIKVATTGLGKECIGQSISQIKNVVENIKYCNVCGEGGEYETLVLYMPDFTKRIKLQSYDVKRHPDEPEREWNVYFMTSIKYAVEEIPK